MSDDVKALMLAVDASVVLAERNMARLSKTVERERAQMQAQLTALDKSFEKVGAGIGRAGGLLKSFAAGALTGLLGGSFTVAAKTALEYAGSLGEVASQVGTTTRFLQEFRFAAAQSGLSTEEADAALARLTRTLGEAQTGSRNAIAAFKAIGVSQKELANLSAEQAYMRIADAVAAIPDPTRRAALEIEFFGRAGQKLNPLLEQGAEGFRMLATEAQAFGIVLSDQQIQDADKTADKIAALQNALQMKIAATVADNAASIGSLANSIADLASEAAKLTPEQWKYIAAAGVAGTLAFGPIGGLAAAGAVAYSGMDANADRRAAMPGTPVAGARYDPKTGKFTGLPGSASTTPARPVIDRLNAPATARSRRAAAPRKSAMVEYREEADAMAAARASFLGDELTKLTQLPEYEKIFEQDFSDLFDIPEMDLDTSGLDLIADKLRGADELQRDFNRDLSRGLADAIVYGDSLGDVLESTFKRAAAALLESGILNIISGGKQGVPFGDIFKSFGGFFADGGTLGAGKWGIAGEAGPEIIRGPAAIYPMRGTAAGGGAPIIFDFSGAVVTEDLLRQANEISMRNGLAGASLAGDTFRQYTRRKLRGGPGA